MAFSLKGFSQVKKQIRFFDRECGAPVADVIVRHAQGNDTLIFISNNAGQVIIQQDITPFSVSHINYRDTLVAQHSSRILLAPLERKLDRLVINSEEKENKLLTGVAGLFYDFRINLGHNTKAALLIPQDKKNRGRSIKSLKYEVIDVYGVKNLKYLPFRAALYSVDTLTGMPGVKIYDAGIIEKQDNKKWVSITVKEEIIVPENGLFIVFECLGDDFYGDRTIWSKQGLIDAAPSLAAEMYNSSNPHKSFIYESCTADMDCEGMQWFPIRCHFGMDVEYRE